MTALHVFDMDGTLLRGTSASVELARHAGHSAELDLLEKLSAEGALSNVEFHRRTHPLWQNLTDTVIDTIFDAAPWMENLRPVFEDITARGEDAIVISMSPLFFVQRLLHVGVHEVFASVNPIGQVFNEAQILEATHKIDIVADYVRLRGLHPDRVVAYGDSYTDIPLFSSGVRSVSVNASAQVEALAFQNYRGKNLQEAYHLGRGLLA